MGVRINWRKKLKIKRRYRIINLEKKIFNFDLKTLIFDEFTTSFGKELHTRTEYGATVRENCSVEHLPTTKQ